MELQLTGLIMSVMLSLAATIVSSLILFNLKGMAARIVRLEDGQQRLADRKSECQRDFVSAEQWVRSETYTRSKLDRVTASMASLAASIKVVERMPEIAGNIAREIARANLAAKKNQGESNG